MLTRRSRRRSARPHEAMSRTSLSEHVRIGELDGIEDRAFNDELASLHVVTRRIHAIERKHLSGTQVSDGKAASRRIAAKDGRVIAQATDRRSAASDRTDRTRTTARRRTERLTADRFGDCRGLLVRVLHGFESDALAAREAVVMRSAIADRIDIGQRGATELIDVNAVTRERAARRSSGSIVRNDADADDHHARAASTLAGCKPHAGHAAAATLDALDGSLGANLDAMRAMLGCEKSRDVWPATRDSTRGSISSNVDGFAELAKHSRGFETDVAATNDHDALDAAAARAACDRCRPRLRTLVNASEIGTGAREVSWPAAGCPDQRVVLEAMSLLADRDLLRRDRLARCADRQTMLMLRSCQKCGGRSSKSLERSSCPAR